MAFWGKKPKEKELPIPITEPPKDVPIDRIISMKQSMPDNQIIETLQREGYSSSQIFDAMNQAELNPNIPLTPYPAEQMEMPQPYPQEEPKEKTEELIEVMIDEKWNELVKDINKIIEWKNKIEKRLSELEQNINILKDNFNILKKNILSKMTQYDKGISGVSTSIKAMETAFSKILPTFTENVSELSRITKKIKKS